MSFIVTPVDAYHVRVESLDGRHILTADLGPARQLAAQITAAADEAESEPMFTDAQIEAIVGVWRGEWTIGSLEADLRALRVKRGES